MPLIGCTIPDEPVDDVVLLVNCHPGQDCNFESSDGRVHLFIPAAAIPETGLDITAQPASNPTGSMTLVPGTAWDVGPTGTTFNPRAQLSIAYDTAFVQGLAGVRESELGLYEDSSQQWHIVDSLVLDTAGTTVTAWIAGLSVYGILGAPVDTVLVSPSPAAVVVGQTLQLTAEPRSANQVVLPDRPVTWSTGDAAVATVDPVGVVTGFVTGETSILATASQGNPGSTTVTVTVDPGGATAAVVFWAQSPAPDVAAYRVHVGESSRNYTRFETVPAPADSLSFTDLATDRTYYFAVTAIDWIGNESVLSEEVSVDLSTPAAKIAASANL